MTRVTLWLDKADKGSDIIGLLERKQILFEVKYVTNGHHHEAILFTPLGSFEGEREIRRAVGVLSQ